MPQKASTRKPAAKPKPRKAAPTRRAKPAAKKPAKRRGGKVTERDRGFAAVPGAMAAAALTPGQKRQIVHHCIVACAGSDNFSSNQALSTIRQGVEQCVEACVIDAIHRPITVRATDTEDLIVGRI